jgi:hypothetical protein
MHQTHQADERVPAPFEPDTLLSSQYFDRLRAPHRSGEFRLMVAILEDAIHIYRTHAARGGSEFEEAEAWIENRDDSYVFSFQSICDIADLNADYLRRGLHAWKARALARTPIVDAPMELESEPLRRASGE